MAGYGDCLSAVGEAAAAAGRELSEAEIERVFTRTHGLMRRFEREGMGRADAADRAGAQLGAEIRTAALIEKRSAAINLLRRQALDARVTPGKEARDVRALLTGVEGKGRDLANSIDAQRFGIHAQLLGPMTDKLRKAGLLKVLQKRDQAFERDLAREMWRLNDPRSGEPTGNGPAAAAAKILQETQERTRLLQNEAGAWIGKEEHYVTRQSHDMLKVRGDSSPEAYAAWRDAIAPKLDERTYDGLIDDTPAEREAFLNATWAALASGVHDTAQGSDLLAGFKGPANLAKRASQQRVLHFRDADAWFDYNRQFGKGGVVDGVLAGIEQGSRNVAVMRALGTNPGAMFEGWVGGLIENAKARGDFKTVDKLRGDWNNRIFDQVTGQASLPGSGTLYKIAAGMRVMQQLSKLGAVVLSSIPDVAVTAAALRHNGVGLLESYAHQVGALLPGKGAARAEVADQLGVGLAGMMRGIASRFRGEEGVSGRAAQLVDSFYKWNGLTWWTDSLMDGMGDMLSHNLARNAGRELGQLPSRLQTTLQRYGIERAEWDAIRASATKAADGRSYVFAHMIQDEGLATKLQTYLVDQVREGMTEPTAGVRTLATWGTKAGSPAGELVRTLMQFKTFTLTYMTRSLGREFRRDGIDVGGAAQLIAMTTLLGYGSMTLKELVKGRSPRKPESLGDYAKVGAAAMTQGGGLGIYGDFLFGEANRMGGGFIGTMAGPSAGTIEDVRNVLMALRDGVAERGWGEGARRGAAQGFQAVKNNAPFLNLFYARTALDYGILYQLQEMMNPGYLARYERNVQKQNNQTFWLRPSKPALPQIARMVSLQ